VREVVSPTACVGCLDTRKCWVCLGEGSTEIGYREQDALDQRAVCSSCGGTGICVHCAERADVAVTGCGR
jgi:hypothetical protein